MRVYVRPWAIEANRVKAPELRDHVFVIDRNGEQEFVFSGDLWLGPVMIGRLQYDPAAGKGLASAWLELNSAIEIKVTGTALRRPETPR